MSTPWCQNRYCCIFTFSTQKLKVLPWLLGPNTWLIRSPKVHSKSSRLAKMGKKWKGVDLQFHFWCSSFFFSPSFSLESCMIRKGSFGASFSNFILRLGIIRENETHLVMYIKNIFLLFSTPRNNTHTHTHTHIYIYIYMYVCVCVWFDRSI